MAVMAAAWALGMRRTEHDGGCGCEWCGKEVLLE